MSEAGSVPLASIDEVEDEEYTTSRFEQSISLLPKPFDLKSHLNLLPQDSVTSPVSGDELPITTSQDTEEFADTGFFSSSLTSSKRSSIVDIDYASQYHSGNYRSEKANEEYDDDLDLLSETKGEDEEKVLDESTTEISGSLEDLVNSFDEKVKSCLRNFNENVSNIAPVQIRTQEEVIKNRPAWWTLTGNYGNILPIDWTKLSEEELNSLTHIDTTSEDGDESNAKLDQLIHSCLDFDSSDPVKSADEVLEEIDSIISGRLNSSLNPDQQSQASDSSFPYDVPLVRRLSFYCFSLEKLKCLSLDQLQDLFEDLEDKVQRNSSCLINELAYRDELEFEKEAKNTFITLLLKIQSRRKECTAGKCSDEEKQKRKLRYLSTVIPYHKEDTCNHVAALQELIKIMKAMIDDSPTVPTQLTDYILNFICPPTSSDGHKYLKLVPQSALTNSLNNKLKAARLSFRRTLKLPNNDGSNGSQLIGNQQFADSNAVLA